jgi:hypothetical protein
MRAFLAAVLSVIAIGVVSIAYGLLKPAAAHAADVYAPSAVRPTLAGERVLLDEGNGYVRLAQTPFPGAQPTAYPVSDVRAMPRYTAAPPAQRIVSTRQRTSARAASSTTSRRDWTKTALVIGGTTATGAGLGAIFGGKKGALIGAAIGGGAGTLFEVNRK